MRSVVVVLPASMWAMMPMFLQRSSGTVLGTTMNSFWAPKSAVSSPPSAFSQNFLPPVVRESLIGFGHAVNIFLFLNGRAFAGGGVQQFIAQLVDHAALGASPRVSQQPADRKRGAPVGIHLHRHLIVGATHPTGFHFQQWLRVLDRLGEQLQSFVAAFFLHLGESLVENALGGRALALPHHRIDELRHQIRAIHGIGWHGPLCGMSFTRHSVLTPLTLLGALGAVFRTSLLAV